MHFQDLEVSDDRAWLALRWEVVRPDGGLFPVLDADLVLTPAGKQSATLTLAAAYRAPPGIVGAGLDRATLHRVAAATIRAFLHRVAEAIARPARVAGSGTLAADPGPSRWPPEPKTP